MDASLSEEAHALAGRIVGVGGLLEIEVDLEGTIDAAGDSTDRYYAVYGADGHLLYSTSPNAPERAPTSTPFQTRAGFREARVSGPNESVAVVGRSLDAVYADVRRLATSLSLASLVGVVLTLPAAAWLRRQLARSIASIDQTARLLAPGRPTRVDTGRVADEFVGVAGALNRAFDRLDDALERERRFTSDASHELRTPATTLLAEARWALDRPRTVDEYRRSLDVCVRQAARMKELVESLLTLARLDAGTMPPVRVEVDLRALVKQVFADLEPARKEHSVELRVVGDAVVRADAVQMRILVSNLLSNGIRYNRAGGEVRVSLQGSLECVSLVVSDTGPGLPPELAVRAFERFWRADTARSTRDGGTGLGLAIARTITEAHAGRISVASTPGEGTTFRVELPARQG